MKKIIAILMGLMLASASLSAAPAYPYPIRVKQPDGSTVTIRLHGDEFYHYATTLDGNVVAQDADGFYRPALKPVKNMAAINAARKRMARAAIRPSATDRISIGQKKFLVILVEFSDLSFTLTDANAAFTAMLNEKGYSANSATGSVYDYYYDNSRGQFSPEYVVVGPVKVSKAFAAYGGNNTDDSGSRTGDKDPSGAFKEACNLAKQQGLVNFADFDNDGDKYIDNIFFYFAGHNEAEGGGDDTIWPHASWMSGFSADGVSAGSYACTSEYRGSTGTNMAGIGTFCHEFGHVLGLPDFYDTDYEENGSAQTVYNFSLMCGGNYNNNGRTPPYLGVFERWMLGWKEDIEEWSTSGAKTIRPVYENDGYCTPTSTEGEYFIYEVRDGSGWDTYLKSDMSHDATQGMVVYHVDMSDNELGGKKIYSLWNSNELNCFAVHPCYYIVHPTTSFRGYNDLMFPGASGTTEFTPVDWAKLETGYKLSNISYAESTVSLNLEIEAGKTLVGKVTDSDGNPLEGVEVSITADGSEAMQQLLRSRSLISLRDVSNAASGYAVTGSDGTYEIKLATEDKTSFTVVFNKFMYNSRSEHVDIPYKKAVMNVVLYNLVENEPAVLRKYSSPSSALGFTTAESPWSGTLALKYEASELVDYVGYRFNDISFMYTGDNSATAEQIDVFIDFEAARVFTKTVPSPKPNTLITVDIHDAGLTIPENTPIYIGYSVKNITYQYWMTIDSNTSATGAGMLRGAYYTEGAFQWQDTGYCFIISSNIEKRVSPFNALGIKVISNPGIESGYAVGSEFTFAIENPDAGGAAETTTWYFDGQQVSTPTITLSAAGKHTVKAVLTYAGGATEEISQVIMVQ